MLFNMVTLEQCILFIPLLFSLHFSSPLKDPAYNTGKFGEVKEMVLGMLETYNYEQVSQISGSSSSGDCSYNNKLGITVKFLLFNTYSVHSE